MKSEIKTFYENAEYKDDKFDWETARVKILTEFDIWREQYSPIILAIDFGRVNSRYIDEGDHTWYIRVLYDESPRR